MGYYKLKCGCVIFIHKDDIHFCRRIIHCQIHYLDKFDIRGKFHPNGAIQLSKLEVSILKLGAASGC